MKKILLLTSAVVFTVLILLVTLRYYHKANKKWPQHPPDQAMIEVAEKSVRVQTTPEYNYSFAIMKPGVLQHLDRNYTYDVIPPALMGGFLFQGIHRPPKGTKVQIKLFAPADIYFFFHYTVDGGYTEIFPKLEGWELADEAPQYDIYSKRKHGLKMTMYHRRAQPGTYVIPPTTKDRACFNIVFKKVE